MLCKNCQQDIGNAAGCPHCGYTPILDDITHPHYSSNKQIAPPPVRVVLKNMHNGKAKAGLILSFFGFFPVTALLSFIFSLQGFFRAKKLRSGRVTSIFGLLILLAWCLIYAALFYFIMQNSLNY